jgi:hypothetical protein
MVLLALLAVAAGGCGGSRKPTGVFDIKTGMTKQQVQRLAGRPYQVGTRCWLYRASKPSNTSIDGMRFCFTNGRVSLVQTAVHG